MWNIIRKSKDTGGSATGDTSISMTELVKYFKSKFQTDSSTTNDILLMEQEVKEKLNYLSKCNTSSFIFPESKINLFIRMLNSGSAPGCDGIASEHLKLALHSKLPLHLCILFSLCIRFGILPDYFCQGLLIPILKKYTLNPSDASSYRPITVSVIISKILEQYIINECKHFKCNDAQFGFISKRSTQMATCVANDVGEYCLSRGSSVYFASLDAEGAFDLLPHSVLLKKTMDVIPDNLCRLLYYWYKHMEVVIRWGSDISEQIPVRRGTRQGGLTSPLIFNIYYKELIDELQSCSHGVHIGEKYYNVFVYADDILLCSTSVSGLQELINISTNYVNKFGLRFNPVKTTCTIMGNNPFTSTPSWTINGTELKLDKNITYLGSVLGDNSKSGAAHIETRIRPATKSYYGLQGAGIKYPGVNPVVSLDIYNMAVRSVLVYGCSCMYISNVNLKKLDKCQSRIIKQCFGLSQFVRTTPLLKATGISTISATVYLQSLDLLKSCVLSDSVAHDLYSFILHRDNNRTLAGRVAEYCNIKNVNLNKYIMCDDYAKSIKHKLR